MTDRLHRLTIYSLITWLIYLIWLLFVADRFISYFFFVLEFLIFLLFLLFMINHWKRSYELIGGPYSLRPYVDIFIPTKKESKEILIETIQAALKIEYPNKTIYILDDGDRKEIKELALKFNCQYLVRPNRNEKPYKAANLNYAFKHSKGLYILVLDADMIVRPTILDDLLGHFKDKKVALITTRQRFDVSKKDFNNDNVFYEYMQAGKNVDNSAISTGSSVIYRRAALESINGFQEWNIVEDLYTSYVLNSHGFKTLYINQAYAKGQAPTDLSVIYKQRGLWAQDTLRLFFWKMPLLNFKLTLKQRLHYFEIGYIYLVSALVIPAIYFLNFYSIYYNDPILHVGIWYLIFKMPSFFLTLKMYNDLGQGSSSSRMWAALFPVFLKSTILATLYKKPKYKVTEKNKKAKNRWYLTIPQALTGFIGIIVSIYHFNNYGITLLLAVNIFWLIIMFYWLWPVFPIAFNKKKYA